MWILTSVVSGWRRAGGAGASGLLQGKREWRGLGWVVTDIAWGPPAHLCLVLYLVGGLLELADLPDDVGYLREGRVGRPVGAGLLSQHH